MTRVPSETLFGDECGCLYTVIELYVVNTVVKAKYLQRGIIKMRTLR